MGKISIIVPCYNEEESIPLFYKEICKVADEFKNVDFEFIFVNDGSKDKTLSIVRDLSKKDKRTRYISFSRNFGKEAAILAGLEYSTGDYVAMMDADLQDPPRLLFEMYDGIVKEGYDCVATRRVSRKGEPPIRSFFAKCYYKLFNKISKTTLMDGARDYRLMTRQMVDSILSLKEYNRFSKGIFSWVGYDTKWIEYKNVERVAGTTKWSFWKLFKYSIESVVAFSTAPLTISFVMGFIFLITSLALLVVTLVKTLVYGDSFIDFPLIITILFFLSSVLLFCIGFIGQYLSRLYLEVKNRPIYIIKETEESVK